MTGPNNTDYVYSDEQKIAPFLIYFGNQHV